MSEAPSQLWVTLGELTGEPVEQTGPTGCFYYVDIGSIDREAKRISSVKSLTADQAPTRARQVLRSGDVLVSMTRPNLNAVALVPDQLDGAIGSTGFHVLRSRWLHPGYLYRLVQSQDFIDAMTSAVQGALYPAVRPRDIDAYGFLFHTPRQQERIVEKLEELLSDLDAGVAELQAARTKLERYRQSLLKAAVEGALTVEWRARNPPGETGSQLLDRILLERRAQWEARQLAKFDLQGKRPPDGWRANYSEPEGADTDGLPPVPDGWVWASIDQLTPDDLANGRSVPSASEGARVLRLTAVRDGRIDLSESKFGNWSEEEARPYSVSEGDLLIVRGNGSLSLVGRAGLVAEVTEPVAYPDTLIRLRVLSTVVDPGWVGLVWNGALVRSHLERRARTSAGIYKISQPDILSAVVPVPPLQEQFAALSVIQSLESELRAQEVALAGLLDQAAAQRQNILRTAFSGKLVPQDPNDEPASALLERIRAERAAQAGSGKPKARRTRKAVDA